MAGVIRTAIVVFGILWLVSSLAPDAPRVVFGSRPVTVKMRSVRQVLFVVGALGAGVWYAMRRDRKAQQPGVALTHATDSPAVFRVEATPAGEPPVVTVAEPPPAQAADKPKGRREVVLEPHRRAAMERLVAVDDECPDFTAGIPDSLPLQSAEAADAPLAWEQFFKPLVDRMSRLEQIVEDFRTSSMHEVMQAAVLMPERPADFDTLEQRVGDAEERLNELSVRQPVEHRLDVHEAQIQELTEDVAELLAVRPVVAPKPRRKKGPA